MCKTHYKLDKEQIDTKWTECDSKHSIRYTVNGGAVYELINEELQTKTFPPLGWFVLVKTKQNNVYRTIMNTEIERKHVIMKWGIKQWCYE